jgi:two-component sensor histidine kinase/ligand-binding sensor domain-containing protein
MSMVFFCSYLSAQTYNFKTYSLDEGLSQSEISCILEDSRGYLWLGTTGGGVCKFDGKEFHAYEQKDGLSGQLVTSLAEDKKGNVWISTTWGGVCFFDGKKFNAFPLKSLLPSSTIDQIAVSDQNEILLCSRENISLYDGKNLKTVSSGSKGMIRNSITCLFKDYLGNIWLGSQRGLLVLKGQNLHDYSSDSTLGNGKIISITGDNDGNLWCAKENGAIYHINTRQSPKFEDLQSIQLDSIRLPPGASMSSIFIDQRSQFWITTVNDGIYKFYKGQVHHFDHSSGLPTNDIRRIYEDRSGCFWIGTSGAGLVKFMDQTFSYYENQEGFRENDIFALCSDRKGNIWAGSSTKGLFCFDGKKTTSFQSSREMKGFSVRSIYCDRSGMLWIGGPKGIRTYDGHVFKIIHLSSDTMPLNVSVFAEDSYGTFWIGTRGQGAFRMNGKKVKHFDQTEGLKSPYVYSICEDNSGNIWFGTGIDVYKYSSKGTWQIFGSESGICNPYIGSMVKDKFGNLWMGTDQCVMIYDGKKFQSISTQEGLSSGTIYLLNVDDYGNIWVGTNKGVDKIELNATGQIRKIRNFGKGEGFKGIECNSRATCIDDSGNLWFGTVKGAIRYNPREERDFDELPRIHISKVRLFYENMEWNNYSDSSSTWDYLPENAVLPYDKNHITFDFNAINKTSPENIKFSFILKGFDSDWSPETETQFATYSNLPPGHYTFRVKAGNKRDEWNETPAEISFTINKPFWSTWWFIGLCVCSLAGLFYTYNQFRKKKQQEEKEELEKVIQLRTSELTRQKEEKEVLLKEIHHRVKNNLQVINSLISIQSSFIEDKKSLEVFEECKNRIRAIALIHEKLYNSEDFGRINIKDYIQMLVQNMIQTYNIDKKISLVLDLKIEYLNLNTTVPLGLLLNEIISNSFKYAFTNQERGEIVIRLNTASDINSFVLIIGDNGNGYNGNPFDETSHQSLGLELVKILAEQLNGYIEKIPMDGTYYRMIFKSLKN